MTWTPEQETILKAFAEKSACYRYLNYDSYIYYKAIDQRFSLPIIVLSTLAGSASLGSNNLPEWSNIITLASAVVNIITGIMGTLQRFLNTSELTAQHFTSSVEFGRLSRDITVMLTLPRDDRNVDGSKFLESGPGFGGSCFKKDILNLVYLAQYFGLNEVANFWESVVNLNNWHQKRISELIVKKLSGTVTGKKIVVLGFAFKANTNDTRESAAIQICKDLIEEGASILIHDPKVIEMQIENELQMKQMKELEVSKENKLFNTNGNWKFSKSLKIFDDAHAVLMLTEWDEYKNIDWLDVSKRMVNRAWVFDARSIIEPTKLRDTNLNLWRVGDGTDQ